MADSLEAFPVSNLHQYDITLVFNNCGLSNVWTFQNINFNTEWVIAYVKLRLRDNFLQEWNSNLENSPKALNYRLYKRYGRQLGSFSSK
jgi:hypothetical protein